MLFKLQFNFVKLKIINQIQFISDINLYINN